MGRKRARTECIATPVSWSRCRIMRRPRRTGWQQRRAALIASNVERSESGKWYPMKFETRPVLDGAERSVLKEALGNYRSTANVGTRFEWMDKARNYTAQRLLRELLGDEDE